MPDTAPDAARQRVLSISGTGDLIVMTFLDEQSANVHSWRKAVVGRVIFLRLCIVQPHYAS